MPYSAYVQDRLRKNLNMILSSNQLTNRKKYAGIIIYTKLCSDFSSCSIASHKFMSVYTGTWYIGNLLCVELLSILIILLIDSYQQVSESTTVFFHIVIHEPVLKWSPFKKVETVGCIDNLGSVELSSLAASKTTNNSTYRRLSVDYFVFVLLHLRLKLLIGLSQL